MNRKHCFLVLPLLTILLPTARTASAAPPDPTAEAEAVVERQLVKPLAEKEARQNRFSRSYIPPQARRVRILDGERSTDGQGVEFVAFAIDQRSSGYGRRSTGDSHWRKDTIVGCVYPARAEIFFKRGDKFFEAGLLLGKKAAAADETVCRPAPARIDLPALAHRQLEPHPVAQLKR